MGILKHAQIQYYESYNMKWYFHIIHCCDYRYKYFGNFG